MPTTTRFDYDRSSLTESENKVVDLLLEAGEVVHKIWLRQINQESGRITILPDDATAEELLEAGENDPAILDGTTVVKRDGDSFTTVPYHIEYKEELEQFHKLLLEAASITEDSDLKKYIERTVDASQKGDFREVLIAYLENPNTKIEFLYGPIEVYEDHVLGRKKTFQYTLRVLKDVSTDETGEMITIMKKVRLMQPTTSVGAGIESSRIQVRVDDVLMLAGRSSTFLVSSTNLPNEPELVEQYGTKIIVYTTSMAMKFDQRHVPYLKFIRNKDVDLSTEKMKSAMFRSIAIHEIAEGTVKFPSMETRLGSGYAMLRELNADMVGLDSTKYHIFSGLLDMEDYKRILTAFLVFALDVANQYQESGSLLDYARGFAIAFNLFFESGALKQDGDGLLIDFVLMSKDIEFLSDLTVNIMEHGNEGDTLKLLDEYGNFEVFSKLPKV